MKKTSFFYTLILGLIVSFCFNSCKDPVVEPVPQPTDNVLKSKSFEITALKDSVSGNYKELHQGSGHYLKCDYIIQNITDSEVKYVVSITKKEAVDENVIEFCVGDACLSNPVSNFQNVIYSSPNNPLSPNEALIMQSQQKSNPEINSYIKMFSGKTLEDAVKGKNIFTVKYVNIIDPNDYVSFVLTFNFTE